MDKEPLVFTEDSVLEEPTNGGKPGGAAPGSVGGRKKVCVCACVRVFIYFVLVGLGGHGGALGFEVWFWRLGEVCC